MPKIVDPDLLIVGTNLTVNTTAKTVTLSVGGSLIAKDGVTMQALYSKLVELWTQATYNKFPFPMYAVAVRSGEYVWGSDNTTFNGWRLGDDATRNMIRDAGWSEFSAAGALQRQYVGVVTLGDINSGAQPYYQRASGGPAINFTYTDEPNAAVQVFGDASNGNFDTRTFFRVFAREYQFTYVDSSLTDANETATGPYIIKFGLPNAEDKKIVAADGAMSGAPYSSITVTYYATDQNRTIGGAAYPFRIIINGANATAEQIYTKIQYLLRQDSDIDSGAGTVNGKTADTLLSFVGDNMSTATGVYIDNFNTSDINRITFTDKNGVARNFPFTAAGTLTFNAPLVGANSYYRMYFTALPGASDDYGQSGAVTVNDASAAAIAGSISSGAISFSFDYDGNTQGGRTPATDATITVVAGRAGSAKPVVATGTISRAVGQTIALVAEADRAYANP
jgi:hypothetical protein